MCEVLLRLTSNTHTDADIDRQGSWKTGMCITAQEDGWLWSDTEKAWPYLILKLKGIPVADIAKWLTPEYVDPEAEEPVIYRRRRFIVDVVRLTPTVLANLENVVISPATRIAALDTISTDMTVVEPH
jgi:hypothetical protein